MRARWWLCGVGLLLLASPGRAVKRWTSEKAYYLTGNYIFRGVRRGSSGAYGQGYDDYRFSRNWSVRLSSYDFLQLTRGIGLAESRYDLGVRCYAVKPVTLTGGVIYYDRENNPANRLFKGPKTWEAYLGVTGNIPGHPGLTAWYDFHRQVGTYLLLSAEQTFPRSTNGWLATVKGGVGFDLGRTNGFHDGYLRGELWYPLARHLDFGPAVDVWLPACRCDPHANHVRTVLSLGVRYGNAF